ncbi:hypothetical protein DL93DRAFT_2128582 [Clavulina sp. PMI_390]|nr:hypothetical protein DL93DRAFT_2128582 [Clavulina sp. PMI_390]
MTTRFPSPPPHYNPDTRDDRFSSNDHNAMNASSSTINFDDVEPMPAPPRRALTPYLTLPHLLSLTWLAYPVISLLFVAFRLMDSTSNANAGVADAKADLLASCSAAEKAATAVASMPRYLAIGTNDAIQKSMDAAMDAARLTMTVSLTIVESIIVFVVDMWRSTFLCFLELIIRGALAILISAVTDISDFINSTLSSIRTSIQSDIASANSVIQTAVSAINKVTSIVNVNLSVPQFSIPSLDLLANVTLPDSILNGLTTLNNSIPTLDVIKQDLDNLIETPFTIVKTDINNTFNAITFNASTFAVPAQRTLTFCDGMDTSFIDDLGRDLVKIAHIAAGLLAAAAVLFVLGNMFLVWWRWRSLQGHLEYIREAWTADPTVSHSKLSEAHSSHSAPQPSMVMSNHNLLVFRNTAEHPLISRWLDDFSKWFKLSPSQHVNARFFFSYVLHPPALVCLLIGLIGLLSVELQLAAIHPLQAHYTAQAQTGVSNFNAQIAAQLNSGMANDSATYAAQVNAQVAAIQSNLDNGVFGWINTTTTSLNNTVAGFYAEVQSIVNSTFGGTVFDSPAQEFVRCMIGSKVNSIEEALTFMNENFAVTLPTLNPNILMLSNNSVNEVTSPIAAAAIGGSSTSNNSTSVQSEGLVEKLIDRYVASLHRERVMYAILLGLWLFVALCAVGIILWHAYGIDRVHEWKRRRYNRQMPRMTSSASTLNGDNHSAYGGMAPNTTVTPWSPPRGALNMPASRPFSKSKGDTPTRGLSDGILAQDAALAQAYLSSTAKRERAAAAAQDAEDRRYRGSAFVADEMDPHAERTPLPDNLRSFSPLQTPMPSSTIFGNSNAARPSSTGLQTYNNASPFPAASPKFSPNADLEKGSPQQKSGGLSWGVVSGKLRNDARRTTAREPWDFNNGHLKSTFEHSPAPETAQNGWFSRTFNAVLTGAAGLGKRPKDATADRSTVIEPYSLASNPPTNAPATGNSGRRIINLDSDENQFLAPTPIPAQNSSPKITTAAAREAAHQSVFDMPRRPSQFNLSPAPAPKSKTVPGPVPVPNPTQSAPRMKSVNGEFAFAPESRGALAATETTPTSFSPMGFTERPRYLSTQYYPEESNSALPIHHHFIAPDMPSPGSSTHSADPFGDQNRERERGLGHRSRPSRSTFLPPGLAVGASSTRTLTPASPGAEATRRRSHNRAKSSVGAMQDANPFAGSPSPFDDPVFPRSAGFGPMTPTRV